MHSRKNQSLLGSSGFYMSNLKPLNQPSTRSTKGNSSTLLSTSQRQNFVENSNERTSPSQRNKNETVELPALNDERSTIKC